MDWFKQNPFLGVLAAATLLLALGSGYFLFSSWSRFQQEEATFEEQSRTLGRLQSNQPFPNEDNVRLTREELDEARRTLEAVGRSFEVALPSLSPQAFQDRLREMVNDITSRAAAQDITLGEGFFLGFEAYETQPPRPDVTGALMLQLQAIHGVASILVDAKVRQITSIIRPPEANPDAGGEEARRAAEDGLPNLMLVPFDVNFVADQATFRLAFNRILEADPPVFVRVVAVTNSAPTGPQKDAAPVTEGTPGAIHPVLGREVAEINLRMASVGQAPASEK